ncbi:hypothetical protein ABIE45_004579 [Methylobacterium sp. OAE515]|uniref:hypothetical protein n=1 Tax=Methylobacterium sp. OAE515 TaxID=2817895 RepID=UPI0017893DC7
MIGSAIIALVGYGVALSLAVGVAADLFTAHRAAFLKDRATAAKHGTGALLGSALAIGFATLTRHLTGGQF